MYTSYREMRVSGLTFTIDPALMNMLSTQHPVQRCCVSRHIWLASYAYGLHPCIRHLEATLHKLLASDTCGVGLALMLPEL